LDQYIKTYSSNKDEIEQFLVETIYNVGDISIREKDDFKKLFKVFPSLELAYVCDVNSLNQISPNIYRDKKTSNATGRNREYLIDKIKDFKNIAVTKPYISSATGKACISVIKKEGDKIFFLDFNLNILLQRMGLIEVQKEFNMLSKGFYFVAAISMVVLAFFTVGYSLVEFVNSVLFKDGLSIESIFKPVIALTLGLAIFDLAKTILEQEVVFKSYSKNTSSEYKVLTKFSITIIIALLIESLMVVFKIAIDDYSQMINAVYLISGVSVLIIALGLFIYLSKKDI